MSTTIADLSNDNAKDGLLKDVYLDKKTKTDKKELKKQIFGPHHGNKKRKSD